MHYYDEDEIEIKKADWVKVDTNMGKKPQKRCKKKKIKNKKCNISLRKTKKKPKDTTEEQQHIIQTSLF